jgi:hypothetical protein
VHATRILYSILGLSFAAAGLVYLILPTQATSNQGRSNPMRAVLSRIWAGIAYAAVGGCFGFLATIVMVSMRYSLNAALWPVAILGGLGFVAGLIVGNRKLR